MTVRRTLPLAVGLTLAAGTVLSAVPAAAATVDPAGSCDSVQDPAAQLPAGLQEGDRLFLTPYRGFVVQLVCGRLELVEPTGWDSCYLLSDDDVVRYPC